MKTLLIYPNMPLQYSLPHSIAQLSSLLKYKGDEVKLFESTLYKKEGEITDEDLRVKRKQLKSYKIDNNIKKTDLIEDFNKAVEEFEPDRIMISFVDNTVDIGFKLLNSLKKHIFTIAGGVSVILSRERFKSPLIDAAWNNTASNLLFPWNPELLLFDDWTIFEEKRLYRPMDGNIYKTIPIITSYNCPYKCGFCAAPELRKHIKYNKKSIKFVEEEIKFQIELHKPEFIYFSSESILSRPLSELKDFAEFYKQYKLPFWCQSHVNTITENTAKLLQEMGCNRIALGLECGNEKYRKEMIKKNFSNDQVLKAFKILADYGIKASCNNIIGFPLETKEIIQDTIDMNKKIYNIMPEVQLNCYIFQPYYGTALRDICIKNNLLKGEPNTVIGDPVIKNENITKSELIYIRDNFYDIITEKS